MSEALALKLEIDAKGASKTLGDLERASEALNDELKQTAVGSDAFKKLKSELIGVNSEIKNVELSMESLDNEQVASEMGSVTGAIGDMTGAFMLLGGESETMQEMAANIQMAMGVSMGLKGAIEGLSSAKKLWNHHMKSTNILTALNTKLTNATTIAQKMLGRSTDTTTKSFKLMRGALIATGIGALVVLIGTLVAKWDDISAALGSATAEQKAYNAASAQAIESISKELSAADKLQKVLNDETISREEKNKAIEALQKEYPNLLSNVDAEKNSLQEINKALELNTKLLLLKAKQEAVAQLRAEEFKKIIQAQTDAQTGQNAGILESIQAFTIGMETQELANMKTANSIKVNEEQVTALDNVGIALQKEIDALKELGAVGEEEATAETERLKGSEKGAEERKLKRIKDRVQEELDNAVHLERREAAEIEHEHKLREIRDSSYVEKRLEEERWQEFIEEQRRKDFIDEQNLNDAKLSMTMGSIDALMNLTTAFAKDNEKSQKRAFEINKKLQIAQALIGTYQGVQAIFTSAAMNPASVLFPAMPYIQAGIALASGLANVKNISKQQFQSGSVGGSGPTFSGSLGGGTSAPTLNPISNTNTVLGQDNKVYVTETDISTTQNKVKVIEEQATF